VLRSRNRICKGQHHFGADGAGTVKRRGSGSDGSRSKHNVPYTRLIIEKMLTTVTVSYFFHSHLKQLTQSLKKLDGKSCLKPYLNFCLFKKIWLAIVSWSLSRSRSRSRIRIFTWSLMCMIMMRLQNNVFTQFFVYQGKFHVYCY
jgi:hypothetical protein